MFILSRFKGCMKMERFEEDLSFLLSRLLEDVNDTVAQKLKGLKENLVDLYRRNLVKINHSVMELLCAKRMILKGYEVDVERPLEGVLICDLYGVKGDGVLIIEVETGYTPPEHALDPSTYNRARIASKIARYSAHSNKFGLGVPPNHILQIHPVFTKPPRYRRDEELESVKALCDKYYVNPSISLDEIRNGRLHSVYIIDVDGASVQEIDPEAYIEFSSTIPYISQGPPERTLRLESRENSD